MMLQLRFLISIMFLFALGITAVEISVSGAETEFSIKSESALSLTGSLQTGDLFLENLNLDAGTFASLRLQGFHQSNHTPFGSDIGCAMTKTKESRR